MIHKSTKLPKEQGLKTGFKENTFRKVPHSTVLAHLQAGCLLHSGDEDLLVLGDVTLSKCYRTPSCSVAKSHFIALHSTNTCFCTWPELHGLDVSLAPVSPKKTSNQDRKLDLELTSANGLWWMMEKAPTQCQFPRDWVFSFRQHSWTSCSEIISDWLSVTSLHSHSLSVLHIPVSD